MSNLIRLDKIATIDISNVDKKTKENQKPVRLCNFVDVYHNWAITSDLDDSLMSATANENQIEKYSIKKGQVAITKDSETRDDIGIATYIADEFDDVLLGYHCALITPDENVVNGKYLNAFINSSTARKHFENQASGSGQRYTLTLDAIGSLKVPIVSDVVQDKIGNIFSFIDRKISNNNKINSSLESMAKTIYDYWFLQFEFPNEEGKPYKTSGGKMVWNEELKREIPEGWEVKKLKKLVTTIDNRGKNPPYSDNITRYPIIDVATLRNNGRAINYSECSKYVSDDTYNNWFRAGHPQKGDILFSTVGSLAETKLYYPDDNILGSIAQNVIGLRTSATLWSYLYQILVIEKEKIIGYKIGSVQPSLKVGHVLEHKIIVPIENILRKYSNIIEPINETTCKITKENRELASLRDFLLPLLMNGQVGFKDN